MSPPKFVGGRIDPAECSKIIRENFRASYEAGYTLLLFKYTLKFFLCQHLFKRNSFQTRIDECVQGTETGDGSKPGTVLAKFLI